jgi:hypothetical protein
MMLMMGGGMRGGGSAFSVDDDYDALRHTVWLARTPHTRRPIEQLEKKKAHLQVKTVKDRPADFSKEEPVVAVQPLEKLELDRDRWTTITRKVSGLFREYPRVQSSTVMFMAQAENRWFVNSEGFRHRVGESGIGPDPPGELAADDGMKMSDYEIFMGRAEKDLPSEEAIEKGTRRAGGAAHEAVAGAARGGVSRPLLLEGQAASEFFAQTLAPSLGTPTRPWAGQPMMAMMGNNGQGGNLLKEKIGKKVLPGFVSVTDDPGARGVRRHLAPRRLTRSTTTASRARRSRWSRRAPEDLLHGTHSPRAASRARTGTERAARAGSPTSSSSSDAPKKPEELRARLLELAKDEDLKRSTSSRRISNMLSSVMNPQSLLSVMMGRMAAGRRACRCCRRSSCTG